MESVSELRPKGNARCPYCHDALTAAEPTTSCGNCAAAHHADCFAELGKCASCGQGAQKEFVPYIAPPAEETPLTQIALKLLIAIAVPLIALSFLARYSPAFGCALFCLGGVGAAVIGSRARRELQR